MGKIKKRGKSKPWTTAEEKTLIELFPHFGAGPVANRLGRTEKAIVCRAKKLKIEHLKFIAISNADIEALLIYAQKRMKGGKGTVLIYYSTENDRLIAKPSQWQLTRAVQKQLLDRPELIAGKYVRGTPVDVMRPDVRALAARLNGRPSEKNSKNRKTRSRKENKSMGMNYPLTAPLGERKTCIHFLGALNHVA